jgi:hypothetical protein
MSAVPYPCPSCGATDAWVADYYEAVNQTITLFVDDEGEPWFGDYTGVTDSYDDGSTEDECYRCRSCDHTIKLGTFRFVPDGGYVLIIESDQELAALRSALKRRISGQKLITPETLSAISASKLLLERAEALDKEAAC